MGTGTRSHGDMEANGYGQGAHILWTWGVVMGIWKLMDMHRGHTFSGHGARYITGVNTHPEIQE